MQNNSRFRQITIIISGLLLGVVAPVFSQAPGVRQKALELRNPLVVLAISLQPGDEDFSTLEDLRFSRGALVTCAYLTNGESGESDLGSSYPNDLAALRREEATQAIESIAGGVFFLNIASPGAVKDSAGLWRIWDRDTVVIRIMRLLSSIRPHLVVLFPERFSVESSTQWTELKNCLRLAIQRLQQPTNVQELQRLAGLPVWEVQRAVVGRKVAGKTQKQALKSGKSKGHYPSMERQQLIAPLYSTDFSEVIHAARSRKTRRVHDGLPLPPSPALTTLKRRIDKLTSTILSSNRSTGARRKGHLKEIASIADSVDYLIGMRYAAFRGPDQKMLLLWKEGLQDLKNEILGVSVTYSLADSVLTSVQVTALTIDSVKGASQTAQRWFFFPPARQGWIINESKNNRFPLSGQTVFRIISPENFHFNLPAQQDGLERNSLYSPIDCFVVQSDSDRTNSFGIRLRLPFRFAPKFTVEVLTPVIRAVDGEKVVVRTTNHSNDGVSDRIGVSDSLATSSKASFRLSRKGSSQTDTLTLEWKSPVPNGDHLLHIEIGGVDVATFAARSFEAGTDKDKRIGIITTDGMSAAYETFRRLGVVADRRRTGSVTAEWLSSRDIILLDHRIYSLDSSVARLSGPLLERARAGGHVIVLSQDAASWNANPLLKEFVLRPNSKLEPHLRIHSADEERLMSYPNMITAEDWDGWMFSRASNEIIVPPTAETLLSMGEHRIPAVVRKKVGSGKVTFVNLNLPPQWLNIHPGSFRFLANLLVD